jgi:hypothetical protein
MPVKAIWVMPLIALIGCSVPKRGEIAPPPPPEPTYSAPVYAPPPKTTAQMFEELLKSHGLPTNVNYPYWPLVYDTQRIFAGNHIRGTITNYGKSRISRLSVSFDLYEMERKVGEADDYLSSLGPGETWEYDAYTWGRGQNSKGPYIQASGIMGDPRL